MDTYAVWVFLYHIYTNKKALFVSIVPVGVWLAVGEEDFLSAAHVLRGHEVQALLQAAPARPHVAVQGGVVDAVPGRHLPPGEGCVVHELLACVLAAIQLTINCSSSFFSSLTCISISFLIVFFTKMAESPGTSVCCVWRSHQSTSCEGVVAVMQVGESMRVTTVPHGKSLWAKRPSPTDELRLPRQQHTTPFLPASPTAEPTRHSSRHDACSPAESSLSDRVLREGFGMVVF